MTAQSRGSSADFGARGARDSAARREKEMLMFLRESVSRIRRGGGEPPGRRATCGRILYQPALRRINSRRAAGAAAAQTLELIARSWHGACPAPGSRLP